MCSDGRWIETWVPNPRFVLSSAAGDTLEVRSDLASTRDDDARIPPDPENIIVLAHYWPAMREAIARFPSDDWVRVAAEAGVPLQLVRTPEEALADPRSVAEGAVVDIEHPDHGRLRQVGVLYGMSATPGAVQGPVPRVGQHNDEVRAEVAAVRDDDGTEPPFLGSGAPPFGRRHRPRPRLRRGRTLRHPGALRSRRQRDQDQRHPGSLVARHPHRLRLQPGEAQHLHRPQEARRAGRAPPAGGPRRRRALQHAPGRPRAARL